MWVVYYLIIAVLVLFAFGLLRDFLFGRTIGSIEAMWLSSLCAVCWPVSAFVLVGWVVFNTGIFIKRRLL